MLPFGERSKSRLARAARQRRGSRAVPGTRLGAARWRSAARRRWPRHRSGGGERDRVDGAHRRCRDAGARQLSPRQSARGAADRRRAGCATSTITCSTTCCAASASTCASSRRRSNPKEARMSRPHALARTSTRLIRRRPARCRERDVAAAAASAASGESGIADRRLSFFAGPRVRGGMRLGERRSQRARVDRGASPMREPGDARSAGARCDCAAAWRQDDHAGVLRWNAFLIASPRDRRIARRGSAPRQRVAARARRTRAHAPSVFPLNAANTPPGVSHASAFAFACARWNIEPTACSQTYAWAWAENQVLAAVKLVPLGQSAAQRMLHALCARIPLLVERAHKLTDSDIGISTALSAVASGRHETQYSRLFKS